jgi:hypothetical protein
MGHERAILSVAGKTFVVRGQAVYQEPAKFTLDYRATRDSVEIPGEEIKVSRQGDKVVGVEGAKKPVELAAAPDAALAPQTIAEFVWYAESLADLNVGQQRTLASVQVRTETGLVLEPASFTFTRQPDAAKRRAYDLTGKVGRFDVTGTFTVDPDGAPHEISVTVMFGTFVTRRTE